MIIYPPMIADTIPGFVWNSDSKGSILIPFENNYAVNINSVKQFFLIIKELNTTNIIATSWVDADKFKIDNKTKFKDSIEFTNLNFKKDSNGNDYNLQVKQYYKFQIAYGEVDTTEDNYENNIKKEIEEAYYSSASIGRCIGDNPVEFSIDRLDENIINPGQESYTGKYIAPIASEMLYSYHFEYYDQNGMIKDSGEQLAGSMTLITENNIDYYQTPEFFVHKEIEKDKIYFLKFTIITVNGYTKSKIYKISNPDIIKSQFNGTIEIGQEALDKENGTIYIKLNGNTAEPGNYCLFRNRVDINEWYVIDNFHIYNLGEDLSKFIWHDATIEQGVKYKYAIRQWGLNYNGIKYYSEPTESNIYSPDFDCVYLSDGEKQLAIKLNPKISSFKNVLQETKIDTLGSKYPTFYRNGVLQYKEIPISGLISYHMDENNLFLQDKEIGLENSNLERRNTKDSNNTQIKNRTTNQIDYNITAERIFRDKVLDWLNNGKPKLFRSPTEGNHIVRLMNISLSPNEQLSRMLYTFTATGYECAAADFNTLQEMKLSRVFQQELPEREITKSINLDEEFVKGNKKIELDSRVKNLIWTTFSPMLPNENSNYLLFDNEDNTKYYNTLGTFKSPQNIEFNKITIQLNSSPAGMLYYTELPKLNGENVSNKEFEELINVKKIFKSYQEEITIQPKKIYYLLAYKNALKNPNEEKQVCEIGFNNSTIDLNDGQIRIYKDLPLDTKVNTIGDVHLTLYADFRVGLDGTLQEGVKAQ